MQKAIKRYQKTGAINIAPVLHLPANVSWAIWQEIEMSLPALFINYLSVKQFLL